MTRQQTILMIRDLVKKNYTDLMIMTVLRIKKNTLLHDKKLHVLLKRIRRDIAKQLTAKIKELEKELDALNIILNSKDEPPFSFK